MANQSLLADQLALVTGASGGIGFATCLALADEQCTIAIHYNTNSEAAEKLAMQCDAKGVHVEIFQADLSKYDEVGARIDEVRRLYDEVVDKLGYPTILFNNAGTTLSKSGITSIAEVSVEDFDSTWRSNCGSAFLLTQLCIPAMEREAWGRIVFCSSVAAFNGGVVGPHYASSKSALHGLIHWLAGAYSKKGITVNGVAPALIEETTMLPGGNEELEKKIPIGRLGKPKEIADTVLWMLKNAYLTNKIVPVDGGFFPH